MENCSNNNTFTKISFYLISLLLLFVLLLLVKFDFFIELYKGSYTDLNQFLQKHWFIILDIVLIFCSSFLLYKENYRFKGSLNPSVKIEKIQNNNYDYLSFLATYIVPLIYIDLDKTSNEIILILLLIIIGIMFVKTNLYCANPIFAILGYKLYKVKIEDAADKEILVISKDNLTINSYINYFEIDDDFWLVKKDKTHV